MRVIFLGTPEFAIPALERLINWPKCQVVGVITQVDKPSGRGHKLQPPPVKVLAESHGIPVFQPLKLSKSPEIIDDLQALKPDVLVTAAFGQILRKNILELAPLGVINVHASLLPKYRGAAPINWALVNGETTTGITTMFSDPGIDTGTMLLKRSIDIDSDINAIELAHKLSQIGGELLIETLDALERGTLKPIIQNHELASYAPMLKKEMAIIDWHWEACKIHNHIRGMQPWPGAVTTYDGITLKLLRSKIPEQSPVSASENAQNGMPRSKLVPGSVMVNRSGVFVSCGASGEQLLELLEVQPPNKGRMKAHDWANGLHLNNTSGQLRFQPNVNESLEINQPVGER